MAKETEVIASGTGRRKTAVAHVKLVKGDGKWFVNKTTLEAYIPSEALRDYLKQPIGIAGYDLAAVDVVAFAKGGGVSGQAGAIRHGISRALCKVNPELRGALKKAGFLTRDPRMKERKKYGLKAARRAPQFSKR